VQRGVRGAGEHHVGGAIAGGLAAGAQHQRRGRGQLPIVGGCGQRFEVASSQWADEHVGPVGGQLADGPVEPDQALFGLGAGGVRGEARGRDAHQSETLS